MLMTPMMMRVRITRLRAMGKKMMTMMITMTRLRPRGEEYDDNDDYDDKTETKGGRR